MAAYEESRKQRLEENKRRMEELGIMNLAQDLKKPKVVRKKAEKRKVELHEARRSSRVAAKPVVVYREQLQRAKGGAREGNEKRSLRRRYLTETARELAVEAAEELVKDIENPVFLKPMLHSHTSSVYWLGVPEDFCKEHMPSADEKFMLVDENEKEWECTYLARKKGLSSGWRGFVVDHDVMDGDCCLFELVEPGRFKVHIVRFEDDSEEDEDEDEEEKKPRSRKTRKVSRSKKFIVGEDEEDEDDDEDDEEDDEDEEEEEEFDSDVCDDHVSEEEDEDDDDDDEDSEGDYSPKLSEKEVDTLVAAPSRASRVAKQNTVKEENDDSEDDNDDEV